MALDTKHKIKPYKIVLIFLCIFIIMSYWQYKKSTKTYYQFTPLSTALQQPIKPQLIAKFTAGTYNHASTMTTDNKNLYIAWYAGSGEHNGDLAIYLSKGNGVTFTKPRVILTKQNVEKSENRYIYTLGNPILFYHQHKLWLFFVTAFRGWSTASINAMYSNDQGRTWSKPKMLITTGIINFSTLLKGAPLSLVNGGFAIPVYNEFLDKSAEFAVFNPKGEIIDLRRMSWNGVTLQPTVIPISKSVAWAFYRRAKKAPPYIFTSKTINGGKSWSKATQTTLPNPDSGLMGFKIKKNIALIYNNTTNDRKKLSIAIGKNPYLTNWEKIYSFPNPNKWSISYPYIVNYQNDLYVSFSNNNKNILLYRITQHRNRKI